MKELIRREFSFLFEDYNFQIVEEEYEGLIVRISNSQLDIELTVDRSDFHSCIKAHNGNSEYEELCSVLTQMKNKGLISEVYNPSNKINFVKKVLRSHIVDLQKHLVINKNAIIDERN